MREARLNRANLQGSCLRWADLRKADLEGIELRKAPRQGDVFTTDLRWADLYGANLKEANLKWVRLHAAYLEEANLKWVCLSGPAYLSRANLRRYKAKLRKWKQIKNNRYKGYTS